MRRFTLTVPATVLAFIVFGGAASAAETDSQRLEFFEKKIRPMLVKHCYECHSASSKEVGGELLLDTRDGARQGGDSGHAVVPGNLEDSLLINAVRYEDFEMPPKQQLPEAVIADFEKWIKMGAPDPRDGVSARKGVDLEKARDYWSFRPIQKLAPPAVKQKAWPRTEIDQFVLHRLEANGLQPVGDADPRVLVRRVYFDLIGLPPTPAQVDEFVADSSPAALRKLIDRLLDSPQFGERWGRHWLDIVRYGESTGMERNFTFPYAWRYRDYVIQSFNDGKPFDQFIREQIAGDQLTADSVQQRNDQLIATGLLAMGTKSLNERDREKFVMDIVDEQIDVTTQAFMGITVSCARCHDHKFDPITNEEYYSLAGIFSSTDTFYGTGNSNGNRQQGKLIALTPDGVEVVAVGGGGGKKKAAAGDRKKIANQLRVVESRLAELRKRNGKGSSKKFSATQSQVKRLKARLRNLSNDAVAKAPSKGTAGRVLVMAVRDAAKPADTTLRIRGEAKEHGDVMPRGFLTILTPGEAPAIESGSGRLQYSEWVTAADNPLTSRVAVNRVWQHLFGRGIVSTVNNFGINGDQPTHPELLDFLAAEFMENGWSMKATIRSVMNSRVYQLSIAEDSKALEVDPDNQLYWRMNQRRLEAEAIRDAMLMASGELDLEPGKGSVVESIGDGDIGRNLQPARFAVASAKRSVYLPIVRGVVPEVLTVFDFPDPSIIYGQREVTTVPTQSLFMMNNPFVIKQSQTLAERVLKLEDASDEQRVNLAYRLALARSATPEETAAALAFVRSVMESLGESSGDNVAVEAWGGFCQTLFACTEFRYID